MQRTKSKKYAPPQDAFVLWSAEHYKGLESPTRDRILQIVVNQCQHKAPGEEDGVTIREIAEQMGRKPGTIYRHIEALVDAELLIELGPSATGGRDAMLYGTHGNIIVLQVPSDDEALEHMCKYVERSSALAGKETAQAIRDFADAPEHHRELGPFAEKDHASIATMGWIDDEQLAELREHLHAIAEIYREAQRRPGTTLTATNVYIRPVRLPDGSKAVED